MQAGRLFQKRKGVSFSEDSTVGKIWPLPHFSIGKQCQSELLTKGHFLFLSYYPRPHFPNRITLHAETKDKTFWAASPCMQKQKTKLSESHHLAGKNKNKKTLSESHYFACKMKTRTLWITSPCMQDQRQNMVTHTTLQARMKTKHAERHHLAGKNKPERLTLSQNTGKSKWYQCRPSNWAQVEQSTIPSNSVKGLTDSRSTCSSFNSYNSVLVLSNSGP